MTRTTKVRVRFDNGTKAEAVISTDGVELTRDEAKYQHDDAVDSVINSLRTLRYVGTAPLRNVIIG